MILADVTCPLLLGGVLCRGFLRSSWLTGVSSYTFFLLIFIIFLSVTESEIVNALGFLHFLFCTSTLDANLLVAVISFDG
jgi:hypothetical protein